MSAMNKRRFLPATPPISRAASPDLNAIRDVLIPIARRKPRRERITASQKKLIRKLQKRALLRTKPRVKDVNYALKQDFAKKSKTFVRDPQVFIRMGRQAPSRMRRTDLAGFDDGTRHVNGRKRRRTQ